MVYEKQLGLVTGPDLTVEATDARLALDDGDRETARRHLEAFLRYTDTELGETSEDGNFTVIEAECLAACGFPTCVQINSRYYENVTPAEVSKLIEHLKAEG